MIASLRGGVSYQLSRRNGGKMPEVKLLHQQSELALQQGDVRVVGVGDADRKLAGG